MTERDTPERFVRVYRSDPEFSEYLTARFGSGEDGDGIFAFDGARYRFKHSSTDARGMFDVLELVDRPKAD